MVLIDSSAWIEALRRKGKLEVKLAVQGLLDVYEAQWCAPVRLEVMGGARKEERKRLLHHFSVIPYRHCNNDDWGRAIELAWKIRDTGLTVPWLDVLIASIALHDGNRVYAIDSHYQKIAAITGLQLYEPGYGGKYQPA